MSIIFNKLIPYLTALAVFLVIEAIFKYPAWFYYLSALLILAVGWAAWRAMRFVWGQKIYWQLLAVAGLLAISGVLISLFINSPWLKHLLALGLSLFYWLLLSNILVNKKFFSVLPAGLENVIFILGLASLFFFLSASLALSVYLHISAWVLFFLIWLYSGLIYHQFLWINKISVFRSLVYTGPISLIIAELFLVFKNFPNSFYANALVLTALYFLAADVSLRHLQNNFSLKKLWQQGGFVLGICLLVWLTARWR